MDTTTTQQQTHGRCCWTMFIGSAVFFFFFLTHTNKLIASHPIHYYPSIPCPPPLYPPIALAFSIIFSLVWLAHSLLGSLFLLHRWFSFFMCNRQTIKTKETKGGHKRKKIKKSEQSNKSRKFWYGWTPCSVFIGN